MMDILTSYGLLVSSVVVTRYEEQPAVQEEAPDAGYVTYANVVTRDHDEDE